MLLRILDLARAVVTIDAVHTQDDTAQLITVAGGDYVFTVKGNRPSLRAALKALPWRDIPAHCSTERTKGRRAGPRQSRLVRVLTSGFGGL
ncbi:MAG: hypothetical protein ACRCYX_08355 [Dermatophilaceae bacterium]